MEESTRRIAEHFQCGYTVFEKGTAPEPVEKAYRQALEAGRLPDKSRLTVRLRGLEIGRAHV